MTTQSENVILTLIHPPLVPAGVVGTSPVINRIA